MSPVAQAAPGDLDPSFGGGGKVVTDLGGDVGGEILSEVIDFRGRIVVAGFSGTPTASHYVTLARYRPNGSLDPSFGVGGVAVTDLVGTGFSVAIDRVGRIVIAGTARGASGSTDFVVARYHSDGSPDGSFGGRRWVVTDFGGIDYARSVAIDSHGRGIVAAGQRGLDRGWWVLARYMPDGSLDPSFSGDGKAITGFGAVGSRARATSALIDSRNRIFVGGYLYGGAE